MSPKPEILHQWKRPQKISHFEADEQWQLAKKAIPRTILIITVIIIPTYIFFKTISPDDIGIPLDKVLLKFYFGSIIAVTLFFLLSPLFIRFSRTTYLITDKGFYRLSASNRVVLTTWDLAEGYWLSQHEQFPELTILNIQSKNRTSTMILPENEKANELIEAINQRVPDIAPEETTQTIKLTKLQYIYLGILSVAYTILFVYFMMTSGSKLLFTASFCITMVVGPGTVGLVHLYGKFWKKDRFLIIYAFSFNMATSMLIMLLSALAMYYRLCKQIEGG